MTEVTTYNYNDNFLSNRIECGYQMTIKEHLTSPKVSRLIVHMHPNIKVGDKVIPHGSKHAFTFNGINKPLTW